ncbi:hypothetical protein AB1Y20_018529 [Prymnesium parvum]|uniref:Uncharacterized protein n=1 Tax=Prymnesium parvum TaxID=97485 RepID=A0AB34JNX0_PRYPA
MASAKTQALLDKMMKQSNIPASEQRKLRAIANGANPPPVRRVAREGVTMMHTLPYEDPLRGVAINPRIVGGQQRKSHADIVDATRGYERERFRGGPRVVDRDVQKTALQDKMTYGRHAPVRTEGAGSSTKSKPAVVKAESEAASLHSKVSAEIEERQQFLQQMSALGKGEEHERVIKMQIDERMGELRALERIMRED